MRKFLNNILQTLSSREILSRISVKEKINIKVAENKRPLRFALLSYLEIFKDTKIGNNYSKFIFEK